MRNRQIDYVSFLEGSAPDDRGRYIEDILGWNGDWFRLELCHDYIQRLFPLTEQSGSDRELRPLAQEELSTLQKSEKAKENIRRAYRMMLWFWRLDGEAYRDPSLRRSWIRKSGQDHNMRRMSRVLKCLKNLEMNEYGDFAMRIAYILEMSDCGSIPICEETKAEWRSILQL